MQLGVHCNIGSLNSTNGHPLNEQPLSNLPHLTFDTHHTLTPESFEPPYNCIMCLTTNNLHKKSFGVVCILLQPIYVTFSHLKPSPYHKMALQPLTVQHIICCVPSTSDVSNDNSVAFLRPGGRDTPIDSSLCRRTWPPFFDFALQECSSILEVCIYNVLGVCVVGIIYNIIAHRGHRGECTRGYALFHPVLDSC